MNDDYVKPNRAYYSEEHGYVCSCTKYDPIDKVCWVCCLQRQRDALDRLAELDEELGLLDIRSKPDATPMGPTDSTGTGEAN